MKKSATQRRRLFNRGQGAISVLANVYANVRNNVASVISYLKANLAADWTQRFSNSTSSLRDKTANGNDLILRTGRFITTNGISGYARADLSGHDWGDNGFYPEVGIRGWVRPMNGETSICLSFGPNFGITYGGLTPNVWQYVNFSHYADFETVSEIRFGHNRQTGEHSETGWSHMQVFDVITGDTKVAHYNMDESSSTSVTNIPMIDSYGSYDGSYKGTVLGNTGEETVPQTAGANWNAAYRQDGASYIVDKTDFVSPSATDTIRLRFWAAVDITQGDSRFVTMCNTTNNNVLWGLGTGGSNTGELRVFTRLDSGSTTISETSPEGVLIGGLQYFDFTYDGNSETFSLSVDGQVIWLDEPFTNSTTSAFTPDNLAIGALVRSSVSVANRCIVSNLIYSLNGTDYKYPLVRGNLGRGAEIVSDPVEFMVPASLANPTQDALGNVIVEPRNDMQLNFFGDGEYGQAPDSSAFDITTEATWEMVGNFYTPSSAFEYTLAKYGPTGRSWAFIQAGGSIKPRLYLSGDGTTLGHVRFTVPDEEGHLVVSFDNGTVKAYFNGAEISHTLHGTIPSSLFISNQPVTVGVDADGGETLDRKLFVRPFYNKVLTLEEVQKNYNSLRNKFNLPELS